MMWTLSSSTRLAFFLFLEELSPNSPINHVKAYLLFSTSKSSPPLQSLAFPYFSLSHVSSLCISFWPSPSFWLFLVTSRMQRNLLSLQISLLAYFPCSYQLTFYVILKPFNVHLTATSRSFLISSTISPVQLLSLRFHRKKKKLFKSKLLIISS